MRLHCSIAISKPPETIFPWVAEPKKAMKWQRNVKSGEIIVSSPEVVGTTFKEILQEDGRELEMTGTITGFDPNKMIAFHLSSRIHELDVSYTLEELDKKTRFSIEANVRWKFPMNIVSVFIGKRMEKGLTEQLTSEAEELKRICEREQCDR